MKTQERLRRAGAGRGRGLGIGLGIGLALAIGLIACESPLAEDCVLVLPDLPAAWLATLGEPRWRVEWVDVKGERRRMEAAAGETPGIDVFQERVTPVIAWPYWPERGVGPGLARPGGGLFPLDYGDGRVTLSWRGGVEAFFYLRLAEAEGGETRRPWRFDWRRFRALLESDSVNDEVRRDPWLADWEAIAARTAEKGFDRRSLTPAQRSLLTVPGVTGLWLSESPFGVPLEAEAEGKSLQAPVTERTSVWFSADGLLKTNTRGWFYHPYPRLN